MNVESFTLSDHAEDNHGKLSIMGVFDQVDSQTFPAQHPHCCLALRLRFQRSEEGTHKVRIVLVDADGKQGAFKFEGEVKNPAPLSYDTWAANLVINMNGLPIPAPGNLYWDLVVDGQLVSRLPLYARQVGKQQAAA